MRMIAGAHQRSGFYVAKPALQGRFLEKLKFIWCVEARNREMVAGRPQVLTNGEDVYSAGTEISKYLNQL